MIQEKHVHSGLCNWSCFAYLIFEPFVVDYTSFQIDTIWHTLKVDTSGRNPFFVGHIAMGEMTTIGQVQTHDSIMRLQQSCKSSTKSTNQSDYA